jgi:hypothetical protein
MIGLLKKIEIEKLNKNIKISRNSFKFDTNSTIEIPEEELISKNARHKSN